MIPPRGGGPRSWYPTPGSTYTGAILTFCRRGAMEFIDVMAILGYFLRLLGALVFGVAAGWLVLQAIKAETPQAPVAASAIVGLFLTFALIGGWVDGGGTLGAFGLGAGVGMSGEPRPHGNHARGRLRLADPGRRSSRLRKNGDRCPTP